MTKLQFLQLSRLSPLSYGALLSGGRWTHHGRELRKLTLAESRDNWHWLGFPPRASQQKPNPMSQHNGNKNNKAAAPIDIFTYFRPVAFPLAESRKLKTEARNARSECWSWMHCGSLTKSQLPRLPISPNFLHEFSKSAGQEMGEMPCRPMFSFIPFLLYFYLYLFSPSNKFNYSLEKCPKSLKKLTSE